MDKRTFLKLSFGSASFVVLGGFGALLSPKKRRVALPSSFKRLSQGEAYEVRSGENLALPKSAKPGDFVYVKVSKSSLLSQKNCRIIYESDKLLGFSEDLELDQLANIKLTYRGAYKGWHLAG